MKDYILSGLIILIVALLFYMIGTYNMLIKRFNRFIPDEDKKVNNKSIY